MEVKRKTSKEIIKSFIGWIPILIVSSLFYLMLFGAPIILLLTDKFDLDIVTAREIGIPIGVAFVILFYYLYIKKVINTLLSYKLAVVEDELIVKGKSGWRSIDKKVPFTDLIQIDIGNNLNLAEKISLNKGILQEQIESRMTFYLKSGDSFKLDFSTKAFDKNSLYKFLIYVEHKGIEVSLR